jgi:hypothetical protein
MPSLRRVLARLAAAALLLGACTPGPTASPVAPTAPPSAAPSAAPSSGSPAPSPEGSGTSSEVSAVYEQIRTQVEAIRGLEPTADVDPVTIDQAQLEENLEAEIDAELTPEVLKQSNDLLHALGLLPEDSSLRDEQLALLAGQVVGYYSPERDELFVVSRSGERVGAVERATYAHEFTHQLQDQNVDLDRFDTSAVDESDRALAQTALIEGDATAVQLAWILGGGLTLDEIGELAEAAADPEALAALNNAPLYLRETALFPYDAGNSFVQELVTRGGFEAVDDAFDDPPDSTEQVLHPAKYRNREDPIEVKVRAGLAGDVGPGWSEELRDSLGELVLRIWLSQHRVTVDDSREAAEGWGGDRLVMLTHEDGSIAIALATTWDTAGDAAEFAAAVETALRDPEYTGGRSFHRAGSRDVLVALGDDADAATVLEALRG